MRNADDDTEYQIDSQVLADNTDTPFSHLEPATNRDTPSFSDNELEGPRVQQEHPFLGDIMQLIGDSASDHTR